MAVIALCAVNGGPGATTTALGLAMAWPRPVLLVEADPRGLSGLLTGFFRGTKPYEAGLVELAVSSLDPSDALRAVTRQIEGTNVSYVAGLRAPAQAPVLRALWPGLADALNDLESTGTDVIVDAGVLGHHYCPDPVLARADVTLMTVRSSMPALAGAHPWAQQVTQEQILWGHPGVLVIGAGRPYDAKTIGKSLGLPVVASIAWDPSAADVYYQGTTPPRRFETGPYRRSLGAAASAIQSIIARERVQITEEVSA